MTQPADLQNLSPDQLRKLVMQLQETVTAQTHKIAERDQCIAQREASLEQLQTHKDRLTHELALLRRHRFGKRSEGIDKHQLALLDALVDEDIAAIEHETLILHGIADQVIPLDSTVRLATLLKRADLHLFAECGHWVQIERMASFNRTVAEFFKSGLKA